MFIASRSIIFRLRSQERNKCELLVSNLSPAPANGAKQK
jgi:hypothetical protein